MMKQTNPDYKASSEEDQNENETANQTNTMSGRVNKKP